MMTSATTGRTSALVSIAAVALLLTMSLPVASVDAGTGTSSDPLDCYMAKESVWTATLAYPESISPSVRIAVSESNLTTSNKIWSGTTSNKSEVSYTSQWGTKGTASVDAANHLINLRIETTEKAYAIINILVCALSKDPDQKTFYFIRMHTVDPKFKTGYEDAVYYSGQTVSAQVPEAVLGSSLRYSSIEYSISDPSGRTLTENTGLDFDTATGRISGTVTGGDGVRTTYTVTARMTSPGDFPETFDAVTTVDITSFGKFVFKDEEAYAVVDSGEVSIPVPSDGLTSGVSASGIECTLDGRSVAMEVGKAFNGLTASADGSISGIPTVPGTYRIVQRFRADDSSLEATRNISILVESRAAIDSKLIYYTYTGASAGSDLCSESDRPKAVGSIEGRWSLSGSDAFSIDPESGMIRIAKKPEAGRHDFTISLASVHDADNAASAVISVYSDEQVTLSRDAGSGTVLHAATSSESLVSGQDSAKVLAGGTQHSGQGYTYSLEFDGTDLGAGMTIGRSGSIRFADTLPDSFIGTHTVTARVVGGTVPQNTATLEFTVHIVAALVLSVPRAGSVTAE